MAKLTAVLVTVIGVLLLLPMIGITQLGATGLTGYLEWLIPLAVLVVGIGKLMRNYGGKRR